MTTKPLRRINLFAGPGTGKTTAAFWLLFKLKESRIEADYSREIIKRAAYSDQPPSRSGQIEIFQQQREEEYAALRTGAVVVSDSPLLMQWAYAPDDLAPAIIGASAQMARLYPELNIFLVRGNRPYSTDGRW